MPWDGTRECVPYISFEAVHWENGKVNEVNCLSEGLAIVDMTANVL